ncbi:hypothetical protein D3OALGA1CA_2877 [Olavius algarvensis associated proteobacterium Delta 3]|nr:hypothetical protein D3OALGA1CA_2877 [Olavius algarvensis associated proteobacterium Delta 3]CAB5162933.1 hypothetical protein D3OALGB2SA_5546 [Olavius algarvensis associated proteobacterium Delta 3]
MKNVPHSLQTDPNDQCHRNIAGSVGVFRNGIAGLRVLKTVF